MTRQSFSLTPFPAPDIPEITIAGVVSHQTNLLALHYSLAGNIEDILLPSPSTRPSRKNDLWKATCFEFFLAVRDQSPYWEFNMSPSGDWNVYRMDKYRRVGFREETSIQRLPFNFKTRYNEYSLNVSVNLCPIIPPEQNIDIGITAIIQTKDTNETYWALAHPAPYADFHLRESFTLALARQTHLSPQSAPES